MKAGTEAGSKQGVAERGSKLFRDLNILGGVALAGAAVVFPAASVPLFALAALQFGEAGVWEVARRFAGRRGARKAGKLALAT